MDYVAPLVGAWIETLVKVVLTVCRKVAPLVGAWIETIVVAYRYGEIKSHLL